MKYASANEHRDFFQKNRFIEFDDLLSMDQISNLKTLIGKNNDLKNKSPEKLFQLGRDLWRANSDIKKIVLQRKFAEVASELFMVKPLRIGYDQFIFSINPHYQYEIENSSYSNLMKSKSDLQQISALDGVVGGLMLRLDAHEAPVSAPFPSKAGSGIYFDAAFPIDFSQLLNNQEQMFFLIVYVQSNAYYALNEKDPNVSFLKRFGYIYGSKLALKHHPIVFE